jgi:hypothetical protein
MTSLQPYMEDSLNYGVRYRLLVKVKILLHLYS